MTKFALPLLAAAALAALPPAAPLSAQPSPQTSPQTSEAGSMRTDDLYPTLARYLADRRGEMGRIDPQRRAQLDPIADHLRAQIASGHTPGLLFVCTHNSRRSHMAQLWAAAAAHAHGLDITTHSGGTEDTAFNPRAVAAMQRAGLHIDQTTRGRNPIYHARIGPSVTPMTCFSKAFGDPPNPSEGFAAVMVCAEADEACPYVPGANARFSLPYLDPKASDGSDAEAATYDERCAQIAREMLYIIARAAG